MRMEVSAIRPRFIAAALAILTACAAHAQPILTIAGGGPIGDGKVAIEAFLRQPRFAALGLDTDTRRKHQTNVLLSGAMRSGGGIAAATAMAIDNRTGDSRSFVLSPAGTTAPTVERVSAPTPVTAPARRRAAGQ